MSRSAAFVAVVLVALIAIGALFSVQNAERTVVLSLDLGVAAWQIRDPVPVPALIGVCFGAGFLLGGLLVSIRAVRLSSRVRTLEQQLAISGFASPPGASSPRRDPGASDPTVRDTRSW